MRHASSGRIDMTAISDRVAALMKQYRSVRPEALLVVIKTTTPPIFTLEVPAFDSILTELQRRRIASELGCYPPEVKGGLYIWRGETPGWADATDRTIIEAIKQDGAVNFESVAEAHGISVEEVRRKLWNLKIRKVARRMNIPIPLAITDVGQQWFFNTSSPIPVLSQGHLAIAYGDRRRALDIEKWRLGETAELAENSPFRVYRSDEGGGPMRADVARARSRDVPGYAAFACGFKQEIEHLLSFLDNFGKWGAGRVNTVAVSEMSSRRVYPFFLRFGDESILHRSVPLRYLAEQEYTMAILGHTSVRGSRYVRNPAVTHLCALEGSTISSSKVANRLRSPFRVT